MWWEEERQKATTPLELGALRKSSGSYYMLLWCHFGCRLWSGDFAERCGMG
jgi:hypothetical protein